MDVIRRLLLVAFGSYIVVRAWPAMHAAMGAEWRDAVSMLIGPALVVLLFVAIRRRGS